MFIPNKKQEAVIARVLTRVFSPETMIIAFSVMLYHKHVEKNVMNFVIWFGTTVLFLVIGVIFLIVLKKNKMISDFNVSKREERPKFFFPMLVLMMVLTFLNYIWGWFEVASCLSFIAFSLSIAFTITLFFKISVHVYSVTLAYLIALMMYGNFWIFLLFPIPLITAWTRVYLKKHTYQEVIAGLAVPMILVILWTIAMIDVTVIS